MTDKLYIWWLSQEECEAIGDFLDSSVPSYIRSEYLSRFGRPGRGRLWADPEMGIEEIQWNINKPASRLAEKRGGIVIKEKDVAYIFYKPGFVTDTELNFVNDLEEWQRKEANYA